MDNENKPVRDYFLVDLKHVFAKLWSRIWLVLLVSALTAAIGFGMAAFVVSPQYASDVMLYVNNRSITVDGFSFTAGDLSAAQSLVKTYIVILNSRTTLEKVAQEAQVDYTPEQLREMLLATSVNNTEVMRVTVTAGDPYEAARIANAIAEVFPHRISETIEGSSMTVVDDAQPKLTKVSPSLAKYTALGFLGGLVFIVAILSVSAVADDTVHSEDYIVETYAFPLLAVVPDLTEERSTDYGYYAHKENGRRRSS